MKKQLFILLVLLSTTSFRGFSQTAAFSMLIDSGCSPVCTDFQDLSTNAVSWLWDFGDATTSTVQNPTHCYVTPGLYSVMLTATFPNSSTGTATGTITVLPNPVSAFTASVAGSTVTFTDQSMGATAWFWDFGDATTSTVQNPVHTYASIGDDTVMLSVESAFGCTDCTSVIVAPTAIYDISITQDWSCYPNPVTNGTVAIHFDSPLDDAETVRMENMLGEIVLQEQISGDVTLDLSALPAGIYFLRVGNGVAQKLVIRE